MYEDTIRRYINGNILLMVCSCLPSKLKEGKREEERKTKQNDPNTNGRKKLNKAIVLCGITFLSLKILNISREGNYSRNTCEDFFFLARICFLFPRV